jgi:O-antigen/teichoic acid export membrane protein
MGLYSVAFGLASALTMVLDKVYASVLLPAFSEVMRNEPHRLAEVYVRGRRKIDPLVLIGSGIVFAVSELVISVLYDARYSQAGPMLAILSLAMIVTRYQLTNALFLAIDKPKYHAMLNVVRTASNFILIPLGLAVGGLTGGLLAIAMRELPTVPLILWLAGKHGLNRWKLEFAMLFFWPVGWVIGWGITRLAHALGIGS